MSAGDALKDTGGTAKWGLSLLFFTGVAWLGDLAGAALLSYQLAAAQTILTPYGAIAAVIVSAVAAFESFVVDMGVTDVVLGTVGALWGIQIVLALLILCLFFAIAFASPKGSYSLLDYLVASGVFLFECIPFCGGFVGWGAFSIWLRRRMVLKTAWRTITSAEESVDDLLEKLPESFQRILGDRVKEVVRSVGDKLIRILSQK